MMQWAAKMGIRLQEIANDILTEQTPKRLFQVRTKVYELLINVVPPEIVIRQLTQELLKKLDDEVKHQVCSPVALVVLFVHIPLHHAVFGSEEVYLQHGPGTASHDLGNSIACGRQTMTQRDVRPQCIAKETHTLVAIFAHLWQAEVTPKQRKST
jgi:hypothetical protein